jgi:hypothetical protein
LEDRASPSSLGLAPRAPAALALRIALSCVGIAVLVSWLVLTAVHIDDRYNVGWVEGSRMALAQSANSGELYPPLYDGHRYGGTRFMPLPILAHAGLAGLTNEYLISGKIVAYGSTALLLGLTFVVLRRMAVPVSGAAALTAGVLATRPGLLAGTTIEGDGLSVFLQLGAVALVAGSKERRATLAAAALCALAIASKLSAVWAPLAISAWFLIHDRRRLLLYLAVLIPLLFGMFAVLQVVTDGRMLANLAEVSFAGVEGPSDLVRSPLRLLELALDSAPALVVLVPFALFAEPVLAGRDDVSLYYVALLVAIVVLLVVLSDRGTFDNHLLDITALTFIVVGRVWSLVARREPARSLLLPIVAFAVVWGVTLSALVVMRHDVQAAVASLARGEPASTSDDLGTVVRPRDTLLSEDPYVAVALGREPVVLDAWMLLRLGRTHPDWVADLVARIQHRAFDKIVLVYPVSFQAWYREIHFGQDIADAIRESYRAAGQHGGYHVYVPMMPADEPTGPGSSTP